MGLIPEEISDRIGYLNLTQIHAALAYYHANREILEAEIVEDDAEDERAQLEATTGSEP